MSDQFVEESYAEIDEMEKKELEANELVQKILSQPESTQIGICKYGEMEIRYKPRLTKKLRNQLSKAQKEMKKSEDPLRVQDLLVYSVLAEICIDPLLKTANAWKLIDIRSGDDRVYMIFQDMMEQIGAGDQQIKSFRRK